MHESVALPQVEFIALEESQISPLISKCQIKVCYVSDEPNRNKSIINKETALKMAPSLRGAMIVGHYNAEEQDFEEHNKLFEIENNKVVFKDDTVPYGFVDLNAKVWFQKFLDDGQNEREYLVTEGYLWTEQLPEAARILEKGNNQSMELSEKYLDASWTKDNKGNPEFFIINEAIISKLCILGENYEPCFEGASITKVQFSLDDSFKQTMDSMMNDLKELIYNKGGSQMELENKELAAEEVIEEVAPEVVEEVVSEEIVEEAPVAEEEVPAAEEVEAEEEPAAVEVSYSLEEIPEYTELVAKYAQLEADFAAVVRERDSLNDAIAPLREFKATIERKDKEAMINSFYMLSDADKQDVVEHINEYSLDEIEAKLSVICVRNKVSFSLEEEKSEKIEIPTVYNLNSEEIKEDLATPAWVKAAMEVAKTMN